MLRKILSLVICVFLSPAAVYAQATITGTVTDATTEEPLPGANIFIVELERGSATDIGGNYTISDIPAGTYTIRATFIGYTEYNRNIDIQPGENEVDIQLLPGVNLDELVVTGVSVGTPTTKTGFAISKISSEDLEEVPGTDPANALRGKAPGVRIVQPSGLPGSSPSIRLRGSNTITGSSDPLIVVDGVITQGDLADIDMQSVESIEIIKGAAAAALYGSLAGNGVVQIITKRGADAVNETTVTLRNEFGTTDLANKINLSKYHNREVVDGSYRLGDGSLRGADDPNINDNPYSQTIDLQEELYTTKPFLTNYVSVGSRQETLNYLLSFENLYNGGILEELPSYERKNFRLNLDNQFNDRFKVGFSGIYSTSQGPDVDEQGQGGQNPFYGILLAEPDLNLTEEGPDGQKYNPFLSGGNAENPLYQAWKRDYDIGRERYMASLNANYDITDWWAVNGQFSFDKSLREFSYLIPRGTEFAVGTPSAGSLTKQQYDEQSTIGNVRSLFQRDFNDLNVQLSLTYTYEDYNNEFVSGSGNAFLAAGTPILGNFSSNNTSTNSWTEQITAENYVSNLVLDYNDRYILDAVIRRDGLSLFGADERHQTYYRIAGAYRLTEDFDIPNVDEWKLRASYGTSGDRPPFAAQYETYNVTSAGLTKNILGNTEIKPVLVKGLEVGTNISFLENRFSLEVNYAKNRAEDQYLLIPLSAAAGYGYQWQNAGTLESETWEAALSGTILQQNDMSWSFNINFDRTTQVVSELDRPEFTVGTDFGAAVDIFRIKEGEDFGSIYANVLATSVDQLTVDENGHVVNYSGYSPGDPGNPTVGDFTVNSDGYVILDGTEYTADEQPLTLVDENGAKINQKVGNATPDFNVGFSTNYSYKGFSVYALLDWQQGGNVYNYTKQLLYFNDRHGDLDQAHKPEGERHYNPYYSQYLYNASDPVDYFVEDATFLKLRELSFSYRISPAQVSTIGLGNILKDARVSVIGRNLFTLTGYDGYDPEVAVRATDANPTNFKIDEFAYPNFRTYAISLELRF